MSKYDRTLTDDTLVIRIDNLLFFAAKRQTIVALYSYTNEGQKFHYIELSLKNCPSKVVLEFSNYKAYTSILGIFEEVMGSKKEGR